MGLTFFGPYTQLNLNKLTTQPNLGVSPPQGRTLKRARESPETTKIPSKHPIVTLANLKLKPSWMDPKTSTPTKTPHKNSTPSQNKSPKPCNKPSPKKRTTQPLKNKTTKISKNRK